MKNRLLLAIAIPCVMPLLLALMLSRARADVYQTTCSAHPQDGSPQYGYQVIVDDRNGFALLVVNDPDSHADTASSRTRIVPLRFVGDHSSWPMRIYWLANPRVPGTTMSVRIVDHDYWAQDADHRTPRDAPGESMSSSNGRQVVTDSCGGAD